MGRAHALELARRGARVVVNDIGVARGGDHPSKDPARQVVEEIRHLGGEALANSDNVAESEAATRLIERTLDEYGRIDVVVTNAGINRLAEFDTVTVNDFNDILAVHLFGTFHIVQAAYDAMAGQKYGRIIMTTSQIAWEGKSDSPAYGAAKGGILGLMATLRLTAPDHGIRVNAVAPFALTRAAKGVFPEELEPYLQPSQVSALVAYLASEACRENGETFIAGGGHFATAETRESVGIDYDDPSEISAESLMARLAEIKDMKNAVVYDDAMAAVGATFSRLNSLVRD